MRFNSNPNGANIWGGGLSVAFAEGHIGYFPIDTWVVYWDGTVNSWRFVLYHFAIGLGDPGSYGDLLQPDTFSMDTDYNFEIKVYRDPTTQMVTVTPYVNGVSPGSWGPIFCDPANFNPEEIDLWSGGLWFLYFGALQTVGTPTDVSVGRPKIGTTRGGTEKWELGPYVNSLPYHSPPWQAGAYYNGTTEEGQTLRFQNAALASGEVRISSGSLNT